MISSVFAVGGCGALRTSGQGTGWASATARSGSAHLERRESDHHPPINLVMRLGDPLPAVAFASAHDQGAVASVALSALLLARLQARGIRDVVSIPSQAGVELSVLCADAGEARAFMVQISAALAAPIGERDDALSTIQEHLTALRSRRFAGHAEASLAECAGEIGLLPGAVVPDVQTATGRADLERIRRFAFATRSSAFSALGSREFVDLAARALDDVMAWPSGEASEDTWPGGDVIETDAVDGRRHLSIALRVGDAEAALASVRSLTAEQGALGSRLRTFLPRYGLNRVAFQARPRGACLQVELGLPADDPGPTLAESAQAAALITEEMHVGLLSGGAAHALEENVVEPSDPRQAAARAAWRALTGLQEPGPERRFVALSVHPAERPDFANLASAVRDFETRLARAPIETRLGAESGQGELWILLGSPCGTLGESNDDAGQSALAFSLAAHSATADVLLEPWLTPDAIGLLAHAARRPEESPGEQAERVARALARALSEPRASGDGLAIVQGELFSAVGNKPRPGYARLLDALSPDHSAWLEPRGTWASLSQANRDSVAARARDLLRGPLRVAVLANEDGAQAAVAARALQRWFAPWRDDPRRCQATAERGAQSGELSLAIPDSGNTESAYLGLTFASRLKFEQEAETLAALLNAPQGPLALALAEKQLSASAHVSIVGGGRAAALIVEIHSSDEDARRAVLEVRRALDRLIGSELTNEELVIAERTVQQRTLAASLDPRRRIVDLWRGVPREPPINRSSLRAFQSTLSGAVRVVVYVTHHD